MGVENVVTDVEVNKKHANVKTAMAPQCYIMLRDSVACIMESHLLPNFRITLAGTRKVSCERCISDTLQQLKHLDLTGFADA